MTVSSIAPVIDENGITIPDFSEVLDWLTTQYQGIYGADIYLGNDSQDGQFVGIIAKAIHDCNSAVVAAYNARSPSTAKGNGLASVVKINGLKKQAASYSTVDVEVVGVAGTEINNGIVADTNSNKWALPSYVLIPSSGSVTVTATATTEGDIAAAAGTVTKIQTPVYGWQTVTNPGAAEPGAAVETDAALRVRQSKSTAIPSLTVLDGIVGEVGALAGVTQVKPYENDTDATDSNGLPAHSISLVVLGGDAAAIAAAIQKKKSPGTYTHGSTSVSVIDSRGIANTIRFYTPTPVPVAVAIQLHALTGYTTAIAAAIKQAVADYINALSIGQNVMLTRLYLPANLNGSSESLTFELTSLLIAAKPGTPGAADVAIAFNARATCSVSDISITVV